jgi:hypothetical protein
MFHDTPDNQTPRTIRSPLTHLGLNTTLAVWGTDFSCNRTEYLLINYSAKEMGRFGGWSVRQLGTSLQTKMDQTNKLLAG